MENSGNSNAKFEVILDHLRVALQATISQEFAPTFNASYPLTVDSSSAIGLKKTVLNKTIVAKESKTKSIKE